MRRFWEGEIPEVGDKAFYMNPKLGIEGWVEVSVYPNQEYPGRLRVVGKIEGPIDPKQVHNLEICRDLAVIPGEGVMLLETSMLWFGGTGTVGDQKEVYHRVMKELESHNRELVSSYTSGHKMVMEERVAIVELLRSETGISEVTLLRIMGGEQHGSGAKWRETVLGVRDSESAGQDGEKGQ